RQILGEDLLNLCIILPARVLVGFSAGFGNQRIHARITVVLAIRALRNNSRGVEGVLENIWVFVGPEPSQGIHLKFPVSHVREKGCGFKAANIKSYANLSKLLLKDSSLG